MAVTAIDLYQLLLIRTTNEMKKLTGKLDNPQKGQRSQHPLTSAGIRTALTELSKFMGQLLSLYGQDLSRGINGDFIDAVTKTPDSLSQDQMVRQIISEISSDYTNDNNGHESVRYRAKL